MTRKLERSILLASVWAVWYYLGRTWGSTHEERASALPGDELIEDPRLVTDHAITIDAPPEAVWPWIVQMGWGRAGWYTYRWVDQLLFPNNAPSAEVIRPGLQDLNVGDRILDGPPAADCFYVVELLEPGKFMVLRSWTHLPRALRDAGSRMEWTWVFYLDPIDERRTRFHFRVRGNLAPAWLRIMYNLLIVPADFVMGRSMCIGLKKRAERRAGTARGPRADTIHGNRRQR
jgi:hypothetical protein